MYLLNNKGITLLPLLISISFLTVITPFLVQMLKFVLSIEPLYVSTDSELRHVHFHIQSELNKSIDQQLETNSITFINHDGSTVKYELYHNLVRRRVNDTGHEIIIRDVKEFKMTPLTEEAFIITISKGERQTFEKIYFKQVFY
ncbi:ComGF family competence protein [Piscibacillus sp. B03]|uniref:ComGF family competence protein n=1 Tax=Piscibacillus sp. B03 TaxID=3457430 RepID=UPI003FCD90CB